MSQRSFVRLIGSVLAVPALAITYLNIERYAESRGWDGVLTSALEGTMPALLSFLLEPWIGVAALSLLGLGAGVWVDGIAKRFDAAQPSKEDQLREMGSRLLSHAHWAKRIVDNPFLHGDEMHEFLASLTSLAVDLHKEGFRVPRFNPNIDQIENLQRLYPFFVMVGRLLEDRKIDLAREAAIKYSGIQAS